MSDIKNTIDQAIKEGKFEGMQPGGMVILPISQTANNDMNNGLYNNDWIDDGRGNKIHKTAIVHPNVKMGRDNVIGAYSVIGGNGEIRGVKQEDFQGSVIIGDNNVISEHVTIQRPYKTKCETNIGNNCILMAHAHIGHDAAIGDNVEVCSGVIVGGYAIILSGAKIKLGAIIRNRKQIGTNAVIGMGSVVTKNVKHNTTVYGNPAKEHL